MSKPDLYNPFSSREKVVGHFAVMGELFPICRLPRTAHAHMRRAMKRMKQNLLKLFEYAPHHDAYFDALCDTIRGDLRITCHALAPCLTSSAHDSWRDEVDATVLDVRQHGAESGLSRRRVSSTIRTVVHTVVTEAIYSRVILSPDFDMLHYVESRSGLASDDPKSDVEDEYEPSAWEIEMDREDAEQREREEGDFERNCERWQCMLAARHAGEDDNCCGCGRCFSDEE